MDQAWAKSSLLFSGVYTKEDRLESDWMKNFLFVRTREFRLSRVCKLIFSLTLVLVLLVARVGPASQLLKALSSLELISMVAGASSMKLK